MSRIFIVAGEMSGDIHAGELMASIRDKDAQVEFHGLGGKLMAAEAEKSGGSLEDWTDSAAVMGVVEVAKHYSYFKEKFEEALARIETLQPTCLILVDYPGFNLRLAEAVKERWPTIKIAYYISPQVWAWNKGRIPKMVRILDLMLCLFPFEEKIFSDAGLKTVWVGHPLVDELEEKRINVEGDLREKGLVGLFAGSREREVASLFPMMVRSAKEIRAKFPEVRFCTAAATEKLSVLMKEILVAEEAEDLVKIQMGESQALMQRAEVGVIASGTATLEATYYGLPYCLVYKVAPVTYLLGKLLVKIDFIGIANILAGRQVIPEFIQGEAEPDRVVPFLESILSDPLHQAEMKRNLAQTADLLGKGGVHQRAAQEILQLLDS